MERNFKVKAIEYTDSTGQVLLDYYEDSQLKRDVKAGETLYVTAERAKKLINLGVVKLLSVKRSNG